MAACTLGSSSLEKTYALCILPPANIATMLNELRNQFDKSAFKWPCHIRLAYMHPKIDDRNIKTLIEQEISLIPNFTISLSSPQFGSSGTTTKVKDGRVYITSECVALWADDTNYSISPQQFVNNILEKHGLITKEHRVVKWHLSLAQMPNRQEAASFREALSHCLWSAKWTVTIFSLLEQISQHYRENYQFYAESSLAPEEGEIVDIMPF